MVKLTIDINTCKGCGLCTRACPKKILELSKDAINNKGYHYCQIIDQQECIACAACANTCPDVAITIEK